MKFVYEPWNEIVVHELMKYSFEELIKNHIVGTPPGGTAAPLNWAKGIVFSRSMMPLTEDVIREQLQGRIHYAAVSFAIMPEYREAHADRQANVMVPIVDVTRTKILCELAEWLSERKGVDEV